MKTRWRLAALGCAAISCSSGCGGCEGERRPAGADGGERPDAGAPVQAPRPVTSRAPHEQRPIGVKPYSPTFVGLVPDGQDVCPAVCDHSAAWKVTRLFDGSGPDSPTTLPPALRRYCRYEPTGKEWPKVKPKAPEAVKCQKEQYVVSAQQRSYAAFSAQVKTRLRDQFRTWVDRPTPFSSPVSNVRFAVLDTTPAGATSGLFDHGFNVASVIEDLANPCPGCVHPYLALPALDDWTTPANGGDVGLPSDLAKSIHAAAAGWLATPPPQREPHLIINMSVAWEPKPWPAPQATACFEDASGVQSVFDALRYAVCNGALVFAAVGNDPDPFDADPTVDPHYGAMCPARWEKTTPGPFNCAAYGGTDPAHLLYAVGGVDPLDQPITGARRNGTTTQVILPRLNAPALLAVDYPTASPDVPPDASQAMTGSSVATAVASAAAGLVWASNPSLKAEEVISALHAGGKPLQIAQLDPFFFDASSPPDPVRLSIRCVLASSRQPPAPCTPAAPLQAEPALNVAELAVYPSWNASTGSLVQPISQAGNGIPRALRWVDPPWVGPQPDSGNCGQTNCGKLADPFVDIPVPDDYQGPAPVTAVDVRLYDITGKLLPLGSTPSGQPVDHVSLQLPAGGLFPGGQVTQLLPIQAPSAAMATLTFTVPVQNPPPGVKTIRRVTQTILFHP